MGSVCLPQAFFLFLLLTEHSIGHFHIKLVQLLCFHGHKGQESLLCKYSLFYYNSENACSDYTWAHQREKTQLHPPECRHQSLPPVSLHKLLDQPNPSGDRHQNQEELQPCSLQKVDHKHSKLDKIRRHRNMLQMKEQGIQPTRPNKRRGKRQST